MTEFEATIEYDTDAELVRVDVGGPVGASDLLHLYEELLSDHAGTPRLWDYRDADLTSLSTRDLALIADSAARMEPRPEGLRVAVVVAKDVDFGILRMYQAMAERRSSVEYRVFRDPLAAEAWLRDGAAGA